LKPRTQNLELKTQNPKLSIVIALFLFAVYLLSYRGGFHSVDEVSTFAVTENLVKFGQLHTDQIAWTQWTTTPSEAQGFFGAGGHVYSKKGLAISLAQAPLYWLALMLPGLGMLQTVSVLNALLTAATGALVAAILLRLGFSARASSVTALVYGLGTIAWVYAKYLFSGTLAGFLLTITLYLLLAYRQEGGSWRLAVAGLAGGLTVLARANNLLLLGLFGLYLLAVLATPPPEMQVSLRVASGPRWFYLRQTWRRAIVPVALFVVGAALAGMLFAWYNWARSGNPLQTGYDLSIFTPNILLGLYKLLFSPLRGLFIYSPVLVLAIPGWLKLRRTHLAESWLIAGVVGVTVLLFSAWASGEGLSWGSRFMVPVIPFLAVSLAPVINEQLAMPNDRLSIGNWKHWFVVLLILASFFIQLLGVTINPWVFLGALQAQFGGEFFLEKTTALTDFSTSQIVGQVQNWSVANSDLVWWQPGQFDGLALALSLTFIVLTGWLLWQIVFRRAMNAARFTLPIALVALGVTITLLTRYHHTDRRQFGPENDGYLQALTTAASESSGLETIVTVAQRDYHVSMNDFKARVPLLGFAQSVDPLPGTAFPLLENSIAGSVSQVWLVSVGWQPAQPDNRAERWLAENVFKAEDTWFPDGARLVRYGVAGAAAMTSKNMDVNFGNTIHLQGISFSDKVKPGAVLPVNFEWQAMTVPPANYVVFLQALAGNGALAAQHDGAPVGGYLPTSGWVVKQTINDHHGLSFPAAAMPGVYRLVAGWYNPADGQRLFTDTGLDYVDLGTVTVGRDE